MRRSYLSESNGLRMAAGAAALLGLLAGVLSERERSYALILCVVLFGVIALAMLGDRAFPWALVAVAVAPWYPFVSTVAEPPLVRQKVLCAAIAAAPLAPWLWSLATGGRRTRPSRPALMMGVLYLGLALLIYNSLGSISELIGSGIVGYLGIGVTFLCARRFGRAEGWPAAAFAGLVVLLLLGTAAYRQAPSLRVGSFTGYPITYGALVVGLLPLALLFAYRRSRPLAAALAAASAVLLIFSESRSSWVAVSVMVILVVLLQTRAGNFKTLAALTTVVAIVTALVLGTSSLHHIVEQKLSSKISSTQSVTHREWSYGYALETIGKSPVFGAREPGYSAKEAESKTSIGAIDNGYLSISVDMGLVGLFAAFIPIGVALRTLWRCLRFGRTPALELALALGVIGMAVVTIFYDSFYWAQIDLLLAAMGGILSTRVTAITGDPERVGVRLARTRNRRAWRSFSPATPMRADS